jgi:hypothetical protein
MIRSQSPELLNTATMRQNVQSRRSDTVMITNTVQAARPRLPRRRSTPTRVPTRQALARTKRQLQIRISPTILDLATRRRLPRTPDNTLTSRIRRLERQSPSGEAVAEDIAHIVPDAVAVEVVRKDCLADIRLEDSAFDGGDLERDTAGSGIPDERLAVRCVRVDDVLVAYGAADGPEVYGLGALVGHDCATSRVDACNESSNSECVEKHCEE